MNRSAVFPMNMMRLCIDGYRDDLSGRVYSKMMLVPLPFSGCGEIFLIMDKLFDRVGYPQAFQTRRTFFRPKKPEGSIHMPDQVMEDEEIDRQSGSFRTFDIIVQSRRQSGWQGILMDPERTYIKEFRSEMELLEQICQGLEEA